MARYQHFTACLLALLVFLSSVGVNAYAGYCACRGQNFISFLYKNQCCQHKSSPKCCLLPNAVCKKTDFQTEENSIEKSKCCQDKSFYSNVSTEIDKLPTFGFFTQKLVFISTQFSFFYKNAAQQFFYHIKIKTTELKTNFINWLPPPTLAGRKLLNFCQIYRC